MPTQLGPEIGNGEVGVGVVVGGSGVGVEVCVGVDVGVKEMQNPESTSQVALKTGIQPPPQVPGIGGPHEGKPH